MVTIRIRSGAPNPAWPRTCCTAVSASLPQSSWRNRSHISSQHFRLLGTLAQVQNNKVDMEADASTNRTQVDSLETRQKPTQGFTSAPLAFPLASKPLQKPIPTAHTNNILLKAIIANMDHATLIQAYNRFRSALPLPSASTSPSSSTSSLPSSSTSSSPSSSPSSLLLSSPSSSSSPSSTSSPSSSPSPSPLPSSSTPPSPLSIVHNFTTFIRAFIDHRDFNSIAHILSDMHALDVSPSHHTYSVLLIAYQTIESPADTIAAQAMFDAMQKAGERRVCRGEKSVPDDDEEPRQSDRTDNESGEIGKGEGDSATEEIWLSGEGRCSAIESLSTNM
ncbi:hypothetical protein BC937DRAFT_88169 [Endogone sp. FLAS-F59071]|nr:hypothetical protein BC937DRAFT_88169 [Endogone sp. FLAS-F59071]|eukprot:RUS18918.1 hypothetical protein BC937DRAFT_88169 [Endogone sp. FLAS-F59071]